jgi:gentisate 1,2-dioxygenase
MQAPPDSDYYPALEAASLMPGWRRKKANVWASPVSRFKPAVWRFRQAREALDASVGFLPPEETERRNLLMVNPFEGNVYPTTANLIAAYQMVAPGETAPSHRHSPSALRLVLQAGHGAVTVVDGQEVEMRSGDVVFTPKWCWHGHLNRGDEPAYWIDFLDVPFVQHLEAMFFEREPGTISLPAQRLFTIDELRMDARKRAREGDSEVSIPCEGMPTIGVGTIRLRADERRNWPRSTASSLYAVVEGEVRVKLEGGQFATQLAHGDVIVVPCWNAGTIVADRDAVLLRVSDEPLLRMTELYVEEAPLTPGLTANLHTYKETTSC